MDDASKAVIDVDRLLAEALDVDVSPDFAAQVRRRIASQPAGSPWPRRWRIAITAAAAAVVMIAAGHALARRAHDVRPARLASRPLGTGTLAVETGGAGRAALTADAPSFANRRRATRAAKAATVASAQPEVLVPREEVEMYRRLIAAAQQAPSAVAVDAPADIRPVTAVSQITIDPIKIELIASPSGREGDRQ